MKKKNEFDESTCDIKKHLMIAMMRTVVIFLTFNEEEQYKKHLEAIQKLMYTAWPTKTCIFYVLQF